MSDQDDINLGVGEEDTPADFIERNEVSDEITLEDRDPNAMDDESDDDDDDGNDDQEKEELIDDSVQGFFGHQDSVYAIDIHPTDENVVVSGGGDDKSYLWRADTGEQLREFAGHTDTVISVLFSKDGRYVASGGMDGKVCVWEVANGELIITVEGPDEIVWMDWHPRGNVLLAGANDSTVWMWQIPSGNVMNVFSNHSAPVTAGQFTPDGKKIVTCSEDTSLIVWDPKNATALLKLSGEDSRFHQQSITSLAVNKESSLAMTGSIDNSARLINLNTGAILGSLENHTESIEAVGFSNVLPLAATGSVDNSLNIWDVTTMRLRQTCRHDDAIIKLKWHVDAPLLDTCSADGTVRVWDARTGSCEKTWHGHQGSILDIAVSRDGRSVVTAGDDHVCLVFRA